MFSVQERARVFPFIGFILLLAAEPLLKTGLTSIGLSVQLTYVLRTLLAVCVLFYYRQHYIELVQRPRLEQVFWALISGLIVFVLWILPYPEWMGSKASGSFAIPTMGNPADLFWLACRWTGSALIVPVIEELFWRSYLMRKLDASDFMAVSPVTASAYAVVASSVLFAVEHQLWFAGLLAGLVYAWLYRRFQLLWMSVLAHMTTNAILGMWVIAGGHWLYW